MRTFEVPAIGACMLTEDTEEHREIFGKEGDAVLYFRTMNEMVSQLRFLLDHERPTHLSRSINDDTESSAWRSVD